MNNDDLDLYFVSLVQYHNEQTKRKRKWTRIKKNISEYIIPICLFLGIMLCFGLAGGIETGSLPLVK